MPADLLLMGVFSFASRLPQYLMHAMLDGAECVALIVAAMVRGALERNSREGAGGCG